VREWLRRWTHDPAATPAPPARDWPSLVDEAEHQGVLAPLHEWAVEGRAPADVLAGCADGHRRLLVRGVAQLELAGRVMRVLQSAGLRALPLKGAAVSERLYPSPAHRPMGDVDLLVLDDFREAHLCLATEGFELLGRADHAWVLRDPVSGTPVELHRSVTSAPGFFPKDADGLWSRARTSEGLLVGRVPSVADLVVQLALHAAFQHGFVLTLVQWADFRRVLETEEIDGATLARVADRGRAGGCVRAALRAARVVVGAPERRDLIHGLPATPALDSWLDDVLADPVRLITAGGTSLAAARWQIASGRRAALVWRTLLATPDPGAAPLARGAAVVRRAGHLLARWGPTRPW